VSRGSAIAGPRAPRSGALHPNTVALRFLGWLLLIELAILFVPVIGADHLLKEGTAWAAAALCRASGIELTRIGPEIYLPSRVLVINTECTAIYLVGALASLVLAQRAAWRDKLKGILAGTAVLLAANFARLVLVAHASERWPDVFPILHDYVFQGLLVLVTVATWLVWMGRGARRAT
jgi:exosortase/archaeosortase family protein